MDATIDITDDEREAPDVLVDEEPGLNFRVQFDGIAIVLTHGQLAALRRALDEWFADG